jgi:hypothetical protein
VNQGRRDERGAVLVLSALMMVALVLVVAIVIDLGATRSDRRSSQLAVDNAASSAGYVLAESDAVAACEAALAYLRATLAAAPFTGGDCNTFAFDSTTPCSAVDQRTDEWVSGIYTVLLEHPVPASSPLMRGSSTIGSETIPSSAPGGADGDKCDRFGVQVATRSSSFFGGIAGQSERHSSSHAVALSMDGTPTQRIVPGFLLLDRTACQAVRTRTGAGSAKPPYPDGTARPDGILVHSNGTQAGTIHADSDGSDCGRATGDKVIWANEVGGALPTIYLEGLTPSTYGDLYAVAPDGARAGGGIRGNVGGGDVVSRRPVDDIFKTSIASFHSEAYPEVIGAGPPASSNTYDCNGDPVGAIDPAFTTAYIDCAGGDPSFTLTGPTKVVFSNGLSLGNSKRVRLQTATTISIRGGLAVNGGGGANWAAFQAPAVRNMYVGGRVTVAGNGLLNIGAPAVTTASISLPTCGSTPPTSRLAIFSPTGDSNAALEISGRAALCATTVYLAGPLQIPQTSSGPLVANTSYSYLADTTTSGCSATLPCPLVAGNLAPGAHVRLGGEVTWRAPVNTTGSPLPDDMPLPANGGITGLALWAEGAPTAYVGKGATLNTAGVFFLPNATAELRSGNASTDPVDAQFIARTIDLFAGTFSMRPTIANAVPVPSPKIHNLIR